MLTKSISKKGPLLGDDCDLEKNLKRFVVHKKSSSDCTHSVLVKRYPKLDTVCLTLKVRVVLSLSEKKYSMFAQLRCKNFADCST